MHAYRLLSIGMLCDPTQTDISRCRSKTVRCERNFSLTENGDFRLAPKWLFSPDANIISESVVLKLTRNS